MFWKLAKYVTISNFGIIHKLLWNQSETFYLFKFLSKSNVYEYITIEQI